MDTRHNGFCRSEPTVKISILWKLVVSILSASLFAVSQVSTLFNSVFAT